MTYEFFRLGTKFDGRCAVCNGSIARHEKETACVYSAKNDDSKYVYVITHPRCVGAETKHAVGGGVKFRRDPQQTLEIGPKVSEDPEVRELRKQAATDRDVNELRKIAGIDGH